MRAKIGVMQQNEDANATIILLLNKNPFFMCLKTLKNKGSHSSLKIHFFWQQTGNSVTKVLS
jgi:hypothetical protein